MGGGGRDELLVVAIGAGEAGLGRGRTQRDAAVVGRQHLLGHTLVQRLAAHRVRAGGQHTGQLSRITGVASQRGRFEPVATVDGGSASADSVGADVPV